MEAKIIKGSNFRVLRTDRLIEGDCLIRRRLACEQALAWGRGSSFSPPRELARRLGAAWTVPPSPRPSNLGLYNHKVSSAVARLISPVTSLNGQRASLTIFP